MAIPIAGNVPRMRCTKDSMAIDACWIADNHMLALTLPLHHQRSHGLSRRKEPHVHDHRQARLLGLRRSPCSCLPGQPEGEDRSVCATEMNHQGAAYEVRLVCRSRHRSSVHFGIIEARKYEYSTRTFAPWLCRSLAVASPSPEPAPVIKYVFPLRGAMLQRCQRLVREPPSPEPSARVKSVKSWSRSAGP